MMGSARQSLSADQFKSTAPPEDIEVKPYFPGGRGQGKFFKDPKPIPKHRWAQQGFSPERRAEVETYLPRVNTWGTEKVLKERGVSRGSEYERPRAITEAEKWGKRQVVENLSRSTVPAEDIKDLGDISIHSPEHMSKTMGPGVAGSYNAIGMYPKGARINITTPSDQTLIHELGHHVSHSDPAGHARRIAVENGLMPREEAFADQYALEHYQPTLKEQKSRHIPYTYGDVRPSWTTTDEQGVAAGLVSTGEHPYAEERRKLGEKRGRPFPLAPRTEANKSKLLELSEVYREKKEKPPLQEKMFFPNIEWDRKEVRGGGIDMVPRTTGYSPTVKYNDNPFGEDIWSRIKRSKVRGRGQA